MAQISIFVVHHRVITDDTIFPSLVARTAEPTTVEPL
jgi:hypothetical protein